MFTKFVDLFFSYTARDPNIYGTCTRSPDGSVRFAMTEDQRLNVIEQGLKDVCFCMDQIVQRHESAVMDYAAWYRHAHPDATSYETFITLATCDCIVDACFVPLTKNWDILLFPSAPTQG
jgi:hypothetical protein